MAEKLLIQRKKKPYRFKSTLTLFMRRARIQFTTSLNVRIVFSQPMGGHSGVFWVEKAS